MLCTGIGKKAGYIDAEVGREVNGMRSSRNSLLRASSFKVK